MEELDDLGAQPEDTPHRKQNVKFHNYLGSKVNR